MSKGKRRASDRRQAAASPEQPPKVASTEARLVQFSILYHDMMRDLTLKLERERDVTAHHDYRCEVANIVILAAFVTETAINEIAYWLETHLTQPVPRSPDFERFSVRHKWRTLPDRCGARGFNRNERPWTDFEVLIRLRNALAHAGAYPGPPSGVLSLLEERGCVQPATDWFESTMTLRTARWACVTASAMPHTLEEMLAPHVDLHNGGFSWLWGRAWLPTLDAPP